MEQKRATKKHPKKPMFRKLSTICGRQLVKYIGDKNLLGFVTDIFACHILLKMCLDLRLWTLVGLFQNGELSPYDFP